MRVVVAVPFDGHTPGEVVEVDDSKGRNLVWGGHAREVPAEIDPAVAAPAAPARPRRPRAKKSSAPTATPADDPQEAS